MIVALGASIGCAGEPDDPGADLLTRGALLVAIPHQPDGDAAHGQPGDPFYLAVRRDALRYRWFWSVFLEELQPYGPSPGTLGTRVIRFVEQDDKLYLFNADTRRATSEVFSPDLIFEAFPIADSPDFRRLPGAGDYVLIDPAAGTNPYSALADWLAADPMPVLLATELSFVGDFEETSDGGFYRQIITAYTDEPIGVPGDVEPNEYRVAATLGHNFRVYDETPWYEPVPAPPVPHYFLSEPYNVIGTGEVAYRASRWAFRPGMEPVPWVISPEILALQADPALGGPDLLAAMKRGIESWNTVFGYPVFTARLASPDDRFADDRVNYLIVDPDVSIGYAYADWRTNPNTAEIRGATVYFGGGFFRPLPDARAGDEEALRSTRPRAGRPMLIWRGQPVAPLCVHWAPAWDPRQWPVTALPLTGAERLERYIQYVTAHEIGHTLGLRHNFKGSLVPPTSTVMEYSRLDAAIAQPTPAGYDIQAIEWLYGQAPTLPTLPFCTDEHTRIDPDCVRFDPASPAPLFDYHIPAYLAQTRLLLEGELPPALADEIVAVHGTELLGYARAGTPAEAAAAWQAALAGARAPLDPSDLASNPALGPAADALSAAVFHEALIDPDGAVRLFAEPVAIEGMAADGRDILANLDGVRSYSTRRIVIDALKRAQALPAYLALREARELIVASLAGLPPVERALALDLLAHLDAALSPYFE